MTFVRIRDYSALNGSSWFLLFRSCRNGALRTFPASGASSFDHLCYLRGYITTAQTNLLIPSCLQFPDIFKSRTAVLVRITFYSSGYPNWQGTGGHFAFRLKLPACWVNRMQVQPTLPPIISDPVRHLPWGCDYLNHWSSSFHAIQILVSVKKLSYGSLPADLFELPEGYPTDCSFIAILC